MSKIKDIAFEIKNEISCKSLIETITGELTQTDPFNSFDFYNENYLVELKSRRNNYNKYPTTMIGYNKIKKATDKTKTYLFCFCFTDGLYYHIYDPIYDYEIKLGGRHDRGCAEINDYLFIPIELLTKISSETSF
jgi:hypothetical protein